MESDLFVSAKKKLEFSRSWIFFACLFYTLDSCNGAEEFMNMKQLGENTNVACGSWCLEKTWEFSQEPYRSKKRSWSSWQVLCVEFYLCIKAFANWKMYLSLSLCLSVHLFLVLSFLNNGFPHLLRGIWKWLLLSSSFNDFPQVLWQPEEWVSFLLLMLHQWFSSCFEKILNQKWFLLSSFFNDFAQINMLQLEECISFFLMLFQWFSTQFWEEFWIRKWLLLSSFFRWFWSCFAATWRMYFFLPHAFSSWLSTCFEKSSESESGCSSHPF